MVNGPMGGVLRSLRRLLGHGTEDVSDRQLLEEFAVHKSEPAFAALVQRHGRLVLGVCRRLLANEQDAEDAFQATFLLLAQKANAIRWRDAIDSWLYEAAYRTACHARGRNLRRRHHETEAATMPLPTDTDWSEHEQLRQLLDEELLRLPLKYRLPLLLCYLQDQTREEAAQRLGWTPGAVKGRLERGRELLRQRLVRRGLVLAALPLVAQAAAARAALVENTVQAALGGTMSVPVAALLKGVTQAMFWTRVKMAIVVLALVAVTGAGTGTVLFRSAANALAPVEKVTEPVKPKNAGEPVWGEPRDGLRIGLAPNELGVAPSDKSIKITVWYENVGKEERKVPHGHALANVSSLLLKGRLDGKEFYLPFEKAHSKYHPAEMKALAVGQKIDEIFDVPVDQKLLNGWRSMPALRAGQSMTLQIALTPSIDAANDKDWDAAGTIRSGTIRLVGEPAGSASEAAVKDGLELRIQPTRVAFTAGQALSFTVTAKNVSDKPFRVKEILTVTANRFTTNGISYCAGDIIKTQQPGPGAKRFAENVYLFLRLAEARGRGAPPPGSDTPSIELIPGASADYDFEVGGVRFDRIGAEPPDVVDSLPAGKYQATFTFRFPSRCKLVGLQLVETPDPSFWTGEIGCKPVAFEVGNPQAK